MSYSHRLVIYLKAPSEGRPALMNALAFKNPGQKATEEALLKSAALRELKVGEEISFVLSVTQGIADVYSLMVGWQGGCRIASDFLLGEKGNNVSDSVGVSYRDDPADPCKFLYCRFNASGVLTCEDRQGVVITTDVGKPGKDGLCLTLVPRSGSSGAATFPHKEFPDLTT